jgi:4-hydroxy-3-methylbut-2-enyl diphosphate reductase IspH
VDTTAAIQIIWPRIASNFTRAFHIEDAAAIISADQIRHKPVGSKKEVIGSGWFPESTATIGITAGASTSEQPNW